MAASNSLFNHGRQAILTGEAAQITGSPNVDSRVVHVADQVAGEVRRLRSALSRAEHIKQRLRCGGAVDVEKCAPGAGDQAEWAIVGGVELLERCRIYIARIKHLLIHAKLLVVFTTAIPPHDFNGVIPVRFYASLGRSSAQHIRESIAHAAKLLAECDTHRAIPVCLLQYLNSRWIACPYPIYECADVLD